MQKKKVLMCCLLAVLVCARVLAYNGLLSGEKKLRVVKTQWFDIIYPERCEASAAVLYEKADGVYEEVTAQYGLTPAFRMPVVITPAVEQFNAFWTALPYNHIAIYDTGASGSSELAVFSETLLSTFRHELTHAVTYNMKNGFWRVMSAVIGDCVAPGMLSVTTGMAEGATVTSESAAGEGRLNDEFAKHYVKQAKIEDKFPSYHDVSGAADNTPGGAPYFFNGAFHQWLQDNYGMAAYAEFWYRVVNGKNITVAGAFKKSFGIKLRAAWKAFVDDYEVPSQALEAANPVSAGLAQDFFEPESDDYSERNDAGSIYGSLTSAGGRLVWLDRYGSRVFAAESTGRGAETPGSIKGPSSPVPRLLFSQQGLSGVRLSNDGRFLAISYLSGNAPAQTARVKLYDFDTKHFFTLKDTGLKEAVVVSAEGGLYLVAQKYLAQRYSIAIYKIQMDSKGRRITGVEPLTELLMGEETNPYEFTALDNGAFAYLKKERLSFSLCACTVEGEPLWEYTFPEGMAVRSLSAGRAGSEETSSSEKTSQTFLFSWAKKGTMPRLGQLSVSAAGGAADLSLSSQDISGGVFEPVLWNNRIVYIGEFLRQNRILYLGKGERGGGAAGDLVDLSTLQEATVDGSFVDAASQNKSPSLPSTAYNPFSYLHRGIFVPVSTYQSEYFGVKQEAAAEYIGYLIGATYMTAAPWTTGLSDMLMITGGWNPFANAFGTSLNITSGTSTSLFNSQTEIKSEFNKNGWQHGAVRSTLSTGFEVGRVSSIIASNTATVLLNNARQFSVSDTARAQFSTIRKAGPGRFENKGFGVALAAGRRYDAPLSSPSEKLLDISAISAAAKICIPRLLPFESKYGKTYNLPLSLDFTLLPTSSNYGYVDTNQEKAKEEGLPLVVIGSPVFDASVEVTAFSMDIQKAIPGVTAIYLNDFYVNAGYAATATAGTASKTGFQTSLLKDYFSAIGDGRGCYLDSVFAKVGLELTPNVGAFAKPNFKMNLFAVYSYTLNSYKELKPEDRYLLSLGFSMSGF